MSERGSILFPNSDADIVFRLRAVMQPPRPWIDEAAQSIAALRAERDALRAELEASRASMALAAGREEIYRVAIEHIWGEDTPPDYDEHDTGDDRAPSTGSIWAWHAINAADSLSVAMGAAPDFEHQRRLHHERIMSQDNYRRAAWPFDPPAPAPDGAAR